MPWPRSETSVLPLSCAAPADGRARSPRRGHDRGSEPWGHRGQRVGVVGQREVPAVVDLVALVAQALGGDRGSPARVDLETDRIIGLRFGGSYGVGDYTIPV